MIKEYIASKQNQITKNYRQTVSVYEKPEKIQSRLDSLSAKLESLRKDQSMNVDERLVSRILNARKNAEIRRAKKQAEEEIPTVVAQIEKQKQYLAFVKKELEQARAEKREEERKLKDMDYVIHLLMEKDPSIAGTISFMLESIAHDRSYIVYDKSNSNIVYEAFFKDFLQNVVTPENLIAQGYTDREAVRYISKIEEILKEIQQPTEVAEGKYKIPQKYLYEVVRSAFESGGLDDLIAGFNLYQSLNGKMDKDFGIALDELYKNKNNYVYIHNVNYRGYAESAKETQEKVASICKNGLVLSSMGNEVGNINYTTYNNAPTSNQGFLTLAEVYSSGEGVVALSIPKTLVKQNGSFLGSNISSKLSSNNPGVVLPKFVVGYAYKGKFTPNPYSQKEQTSYKYEVDAGVDSEQSK